MELGSVVELGDGVGWCVVGSDSGVEWCDMTCYWDRFVEWGGGIREC